MSTERSPKTVKKYGAFELRRGNSLQVLAGAIAEVAESLGYDAKIEDIWAFPVIGTDDTLRFEVTVEILDFSA